VTRLIPPPSEVENRDKAPLSSYSTVIKPNDLILITY